MAAGLALAGATSNAGGVRAPASGRGKRKDTRADRGVPHEQRDGSVSMTKASYILTKHQREAVVEMLRRGQAIVGELARAEAEPARRAAARGQEWTQWRDRKAAC